ncbi:hypothetical protein [Aurantibacter sp.]|uniref:hypothetical protein n=1 Tax=Aurantibacter sp. TaxID=2807103 RepID=UPI0035C83353
MKEIHVFLRGGLGNQLFQFAAGLSLAKKQEYILTVDCSTGFKRDKVYNRNFQLNNILNEKNSVDFMFYKRFFRRRDFLKNTYEFFNKSKIINDENFDGYHKQNTIKYILDDYFQSETYFKNVRDELIIRFKKLISITNHVTIDLPEKYISIGIRLYEETTNPTDYNKDGKPFNVKLFLNKILEGLDNNEKAVVFTYKKNPLLEEFYNNQNIQFIFGDEENLTDFETMLVFAKGNKLFFNNSSYYWWAAWIAENVFALKSESINVFDNFLNTKTVPTRWMKI